MLADAAGAGMAMQVEEDAASTTAQQQTRLLHESHTSITAALEQVAAHGEPFPVAHLPSTLHHKRQLLSNHTCSILVPDT